MNDVIGMAYRGHGAKVVFDFDNGMGHSTCVACGECVQVCPTGALMEKNLLDTAGKRVHYETRSVDTRCAPIVASAARPRCTSRMTSCFMSMAVRDRPMKAVCASKVGLASTTSTIPTD